MLHSLARPALLGDNGNVPFQRNHELHNLPTYPSGDPVREGLRSALRDRGARSVRIRFQPARAGYQPQSYRVEPENVPLPAGPTGQLRSLAHATINESLLWARPRGNTGNLTWTVDRGRIEIG